MRFSRICEIDSFDNYKNKKIIPNSILFYFKSEKKFQIAFYSINVYDFQDDCGTPDISLHASYKTINNNSIEFFPTPQRNEHHMIVNSVIMCLNEGNGDKEPPIFEPIIKCNINEIDMNSSLYRSIKRENFELFNKTQITVIDSKILFQCNK